MRCSNQVYIHCTVYLFLSSTLMLKLHSNSQRKFQTNKRFNFTQPHLKLTYRYTHNTLPFSWEKWQSALLNRKTRLVNDYLRDVKHNRKLTLISHQKLTKASVGIEMLWERERLVWCLPYHKPFTFLSQKNGTCEKKYKWNLLGLCLSFFHPIYCTFLSCAQCSHDSIWLHQRSEISIRK